MFMRTTKLAILTALGILSMPSVAMAENIGINTTLITSYADSKPTSEPGLMNREEKDCSTQSGELDLSGPMMVVSFGGQRAHLEGKNYVYPSSVDCKTSVPPMFSSQDPDPTLKKIKFDSPGDADTFKEVLEGKRGSVSVRFDARECSLKAGGENCSSSIEKPSNQGVALDNSRPSGLYTTSDIEVSFDGGKKFKHLKDYLASPQESETLMAQLREFGRKAETSASSHAQNLVKEIREERDEFHFTPEQKAAVAAASTLGDAKN
jgi:hypothetical protein